MSKVRVTKEFHFEMAHALWNYDGACKNIHGHSYELSVTISGKPINDENNPKLGMVMDFGELKKIVRREVVDLFDHALVLNSSMNTDLLKSLSKNFEKVILTDYQPTSEMMIIDFARRISAELPSHVTLKYMLLRETVTSFAEWYADEN